jgi:glycosyltransferase involved in cell wall biosynthesis
MIAFFQHFGLRGRGGGARILRSLIDCEHPPAISIHLFPSEIEERSSVEEILLPIRPHLGKFEDFRYSQYVWLLDGVYRRSYENKLKRLLIERGVRMMVITPHRYEVVPAVHVAQELKIPFAFYVQDDLAYVSNKHLLLKEMLAANAEGWRNASVRFVISREIGEEYSRRYGQREFLIVTDGLRKIAAAPKPIVEKSLRVYFMGLYHFSYNPNLRAFLETLKILRAELPDWKIEFTARCGRIHFEPDQEIKVTILPYATEREVEQDLESADLLYMPLPFSAAAQAMSRFSLSTKLVTYLGSGIPILYHGPEDAAANRLLEDAQAAIRLNTNEPQAMAKILLNGLKCRNEIVENALKLARERFDLKVQQKTFWNALKPIAH